jgi:hypothetical protein
VLHLATETHHWRACWFMGLAPIVYVHHLTRYQHKMELEDLMDQSLSPRASDHGRYL